MKQKKRQEVFLRRMGQADFATLQVWFEDEELRRRLGGMLPLQDYFNHVQSAPSYWAWMAIEGNESIGAAFMQLEPRAPQSFAVLVNPTLRSLGYGRRIIQTLMVQPEATAINEWDVAVEPDNLASRKCLMSIGFVLASEALDEQGFLRYRYIRSASSPEVG